MNNNNTAGEGNPKYLVIADFPGNKHFPVDMVIELKPFAGAYWQYEITDCQGTHTWLSEHFDEYPHLFKKISEPTPSPEPARLTAEEMAQEYIGITGMSWAQWMYSEGIIKAMQEYAAQETAEKYKEIAELKAQLNK